ncbi:Mal regulon transcriptional regulator MalI [Orbus sturtevantii]|uniref:Mal regulon transcriptional regulator MalI n=1 Tax=Orbus sturtevantii TaxID=3074109 RepID=UPI00370D1BBB
MARKTTIHDVAKYANVSVTTVSLALSGKGRISDVTTQKINEAIHQLGYIRNKNAANLRSGQSAMIGVIVKDIRDPFYASIITGINEILTQQGYVMFLTQSGNEQTALLQCANSLIEQGVSGIILCLGELITDELKIVADRQSIPLIIAAQSSNIDNMTIVRSDNRLGAKLATEYLINKGHRQIGYLGGRMDSLTRAERLAGFADGLFKHGLKFKAEWTVSHEQPEELADFEQLLKLHPNISAFLCHDSSTTLSLMLTVSKLGRALGKGRMISYFEHQIEVFSFGTQAEIYIAKNLINYIDNQPMEIGRQAADILLQNTQISTPIVIKPELII